MERYDECISKAKQSLLIGEQVLKITFPLLKENKLLLVVLERIHDSHIQMLQGVLTYERERRTIPPFQANFESMCNMLELRLEKKYSPAGKEIELLKIVAQTIKFHKDAVIAFSRKNTLILASDKYVIQKVTPEFVMDAIQQTQKMISAWSRLLTK